MIDVIKNFKRYTPLLQQLVRRDLTKKYRRSVLGYLWSLLNPLFTMVIVSAVFSYIFRNNIQNYPIYLIIGQVFWNFFSESTTSAMGSLIGASDLLKKAYMPKYIFPLSKIMFSVVNLFYSLLAIVIVIVFTGFKITPAITLLPLGILYMVMFVSGIGLILSILCVYFRDIEHLYRVMLTAWMYLTPIFYSIDTLSPEMQRIVAINPLYHYIKYFRIIIYEGNIPSFEHNLVCFSLGLFLLVSSLVFFKKKQDGIILYM